MKPIMLRTNPRELFCQKYWQTIKRQTRIQKQEYQKPDLFDYNTYNYILLGINKPNKKQIKLCDLDLSFKLLEPSKKKYTLWRGITDPSFYFENAPILKKYFNKCKNIQPGEILYMKELPYLSNDCNHAKSYISNLAKDYVNILFEIEIPKGTCFFNNGCRSVLRRCSKFLCTDTQRIKDKEKTYQHIKLTLLPQNIQQKSGLKENFIQKILNKFVD